MPPVYPFIELGMGEGVFMGAAKIFLRNLPSGFVPTLLYRKFFWRNLNTGWNPKHSAQTVKSTATSLRCGKNPGSDAVFRSKNAVPSSNYRDPTRH
jgi:hypothetical protein